VSGVPAPVTSTSAVEPARAVVLISGTGTLLQALIDAGQAPDYGVQIVAVGSDRPGIAGLARAAAPGFRPSSRPWQTIPAGTTGIAR
jgi:phosphoribosylglycinamide formyltransferase-1